MSVIPKSPLKKMIAIITCRNDICVGCMCHSMPVEVRSDCVESILSSQFTWAPVIKLKMPGLHGKHLYLVRSELRSLSPAGFLFICSPSLPMIKPTMPSGTLYSSVIEVLWEETLNISLQLEKRPHSFPGNKSPVAL